MATKIINQAVTTTKARIPTPKYNYVTFTIRVPESEANGIHLYDDDAANTATFDLEPGEDISIGLKNGESLYWASTSGTSNVKLIGNGW